MLAALAAVAFLALRLGSAVLLVIGLGLSAALAYAAWRRHRVGTAIASFATAFGPWGFAYIFGGAYIVFGFLLVRAGRQVSRDNPGGPRR